MSFTRRYSEDEREAIYQLKSQGKSGGDIARLCARGVRGLPPFEDTNWQACRWRRGKCIWWRMFDSQDEALEAVGLSEQPHD